MKKTAAILIFLFALVQAGPSISPLFSSTTIYMAEEEKSDEKSEPEKKDKKEIPFPIYHSLELSQQVITALQVAEQIIPAPCLEKFTPPPNLC